VLLVRSILKITVFWDIAPCINWPTFQKCLLLVSSGWYSSVSIYQTTRRNIQEDIHLHTRRRKNLKCHLNTSFVITLFLHSEQKKKVFIIHTYGAIILCIIFSVWKPNEKRIDPERNFFYDSVTCLCPEKNYFNNCRKSCPMNLLSCRCPCWRQG
jgi:hypothetical protein